MKKILFIPLSFIVMIGVLAFAVHEPIRKSDVSNGLQPKQVTLKNFSKIGLAISADVYLTQGNEYSIQVDASDKDFEKIEIEVDNAVLRIKTRDFFPVNLGDVDIYITCPSIEQLSVSGSGKIEMENTLNADELDLNVSGSGDIQLLGLEAEEVSANIAGSGSVKFKQESVAQQLAVRISGSGEVHADKLAVEESDIQISGSGDCETYTKGSLAARISGSGSVHYKGKPRVDAKTIGSGKVLSY
ncbi:MAG: head GIN domain-containing protein [Bacteroidota bacterium]